MSTIENTRRFYLLKHFAECDSGFDGVSVWRHKQESIAGTPLSAGFPSKDELADIGYSTVEDLAGADAKELTKRGLSSAEAAAILTALPLEV